MIFDFTDCRWGHNLISYDPKGLHVLGWSTPRPARKDILLRPMNSGKIGRFLVRSIRWDLNPVDAWSADLIFVGYQGEPDIRKDIKLSWWHRLWRKS